MVARYSTLKDNYCASYTRAASVEWQIEARSLYIPIAIGLDNCANNKQESQACESVRECSDCALLAVPLAS
jgi:hypothetical protein